MDFYDSKAAVDAMAALQARIKELETSNAKIRKECQRLRVLAESDEHSLNEREASLINAADKAKQMLEGASESLIELRKVRHDNRHLQSRLEELQNQLSQRVEQESKAKSKLLRLSDKKDNAEKLLKEYEELFCEILSPPDFHITGNGLIPFTNTIAVKTHSLPATLQTAVMELQTLPFPFRDQKLEKKREIISVFLNAREIAYKIQEEIHQLELQKLESGSVRRIQAEINVKSSHLSLLIQAISRFRFE